MHCQKNKTPSISYAMLDIIHLVRTQYLSKSNISYALIRLRTRTDADEEVRTFSFSFSENIKYVLNG